MKDAAAVVSGAFKEMWVEDPVILKPTEEQIAAIVAQHGAKSPAVLQGMERKRRELIAARDRDPYGYGYVPPIWKKAEALLWETATTLFVLFGANRSTKTWFFVWAAMRHLVKNPRARVLFLHNDETASIEVHQAIFWHYLPREFRPPPGKRTRTGEAKISYQAGDGFASDVVVLPNGAQARFGNYEQEWTRFEGAQYTLVNASERFPLPLMETLGFRLPGAGQRLVTGWDYSPIQGITPAIERVLKGAQTLEHERAIHLPETHIADRNQDWPAGHMPRLQEGITPGVRIMYFWSEDNALGAGEQLRAKMEREKWDLLTIERRMYGYARNVLGRALPKFGKVNIKTRAELQAMGLWPGIGTEPASAMELLIESDPRNVSAKDGASTALCRRMLYDPAGSRNPFITWFACDVNDRHVTYREWPERHRHGEWATPSSDETKWNGDKGPAQDKLGLSVVEQKRLILEAEGWVWNEEAKRFEEGPHGIEAIHERFIDPRAGAAQRQAENAEDAQTLIDIFGTEQTDKDGNIIGPSMWFTPAPGFQEDQGIEIINTKYLGYDNSQPIVPLLNEPLMYVCEECEQTIYSCLNYRPGRGKRDEACKDPMDNQRYYFTSEPYYADPDGPRQHGPRGGYAG